MQYLSGCEREKLGRCLAGLALAHVEPAAGLYTFRRADPAAPGFGGSAFTEGEMVVLSVEGARALGLELWAQWGLGLK